MGIYARHLGEWYRVDEGGSAGELPGLGGWATIKEVSGNPTRYEYPAGNPEWVAFEWTGTTGSITFSENGLVDALIVDAGTGVASRTDLGGHGGGVFRGVEMVESGAPIEIQVGVSAVNHNPYGRYWSAFGDINGVGQVTGGSSGGDTTQHPIHGRGLGDRSSGLGQMHAITGENLGYGGGGGGDFPGQNGYPIADYDPVYGGGLNPRPNSGGGYGNGYETPRPPTDRPGADGVVVIRVPVQNDDTQGQGSIPASVRAAVDEAVDQAKETAKEKIKRNRKR